MTTEELKIKNDLLSTIYYQIDNYFETLQIDGLFKIDVSGNKVLNFSLLFEDGKPALTVKAYTHQCLSNLWWERILGQSYWTFDAKLTCARYEFPLTQKEVDYIWDKADDKMKFLTKEKIQLRLSRQKEGKNVCVNKEVVQNLSGIIGLDRIPPTEDSKFRSDY